MTDKPRLIEHAFPLKQASLDSVHEKNVRHGHISTLHIWPARRPLAACRAALIATLLPDPGTPESRRELCERIGGKVVEKVERKRMPDGRVVERIKEETVGGILHWKRETENAADLDWFRQEIRKAFGGRAPKVLDPFAGGGAIPLEAMRLGCEVTAADINPVAWFILKCTLEYPQKLAGKTHPLPEFILEDEDFMEAFYEAHPHLVGRTKQTRRQKEAPQRELFDQPDSGRVPKADLAWHVRAWGRWVLNRARRELARFYPTYADFEPLERKHPKPYERQPMRLVPLKEDGTPDIDALNAEFSKEYLGDRRNPRWVAKPTVAYLWARTVTCKNCRATVPLLKTRWLCKKERKRVLLEIATENTEGTELKDKNSVSSVPSVAFEVRTDVPVKGANAAQRREHDKRVGEGTMSRAGAKCPFCGTIQTTEDIRVAGWAGRLSTVMTAVVTEGQNGKEYRRPTEHESAVAEGVKDELDTFYRNVPFAMPVEPVAQGASRKGGGSPFTTFLYGLDTWGKLFTSRQLAALGTFVEATREVAKAVRDTYPPAWVEPICAEMAICLDKLADRQSALCRWDMGYTKVHSTFARFALPILWDFCEGNPFSEATGNYRSCVEWVAMTVAHSALAGLGSMLPGVGAQSAVNLRSSEEYDVIVTDPPYYDAIPYSDLMDFFYVWLRRTLHGLSPEIDAQFAEPLARKWDHTSNDGELIDDSSRFGGDGARSKIVYEGGMYRAFQACHHALKADGRFVVVFAHKHPDAWETLVSAIIRAGFVVDGSWPIQTEMGNRMRALAAAALASSVWLVCKKRLATARPGWDNRVLEEMRASITERLREYWDAGIRGPDFIWAATGPALEAYSKHPVVKKANDPGQVMTVSEFLSHVRRMVVDFVVGQVLTGEKGDADMAAADRMDAPTAYYLLHRHDFELEEAPSGACILYATACGLSDHELEATWDLIARAGRQAASTDEEDGEVEPEADADEAGDSGSKVKLKTWAQRTRKGMGYEASSGKPIPLIDRVHRLMHLWRAGDAHRVDEYLDDNGLRRQELFRRLVQSLIELSERGSEERALLESLSNHIQAKGAMPEKRQAALGY
jgi:putative DNA methylase